MIRRKNQTVEGEHRHFIGVIADTHGLLRPEALAVLGGCELIVHAGDIGSDAVVQELSRLAPVHAVRGNVDKGPWTERLPARDVVRVAETYLYVLHNLGELDLDPKAAGFAAVISGHSHRPKIDEKDGVLYINPGSAGPRRFRLPVAVGRLELEGGRLRGRIIELAV